MGVGLRSLNVTPTNTFQRSVSTPSPYSRSESTSHGHSFLSTSDRLFLSHGSSVWSHADTRDESDAESVEWVASPRQEFGNRTDSFQTRADPEGGQPMAGDDEEGEFEGEDNFRGL